MRIFDKWHIRVCSPAIIFVCTVKIQKANRRIIDKFHIESIANPFIAHMICPEIFNVRIFIARSFKSIARFNQMRIHIVNRQVSVNVIVSAFVCAIVERSPAQIGAAPHTD